LTSIFITNNPDCELMRPKYKYKLLKHNGMDFVVEDRSNPVELSDEELSYNPHELTGSVKIPRSPQENKNDAPHVALANLDYTNNEEILAFANSWGLLGLKHINFFKEFSFETRNGVTYEDFFRLKGSNGEPLFLFKEAVKKYQELLHLINQWKLQKENKKDINISISEGIKSHINHIISSNQLMLITAENAVDFKYMVNSKSLYGIILTMIVEDLTKGTSLLRCARQTCRSYYPPTRSSRKYCSINCNDAVRSAIQRAKKQAIKELSKENPQIHSEEINEIINKILVSGFTKKKDLKNEFYNAINNSA